MLPDHDAHHESHRTGHSLADRIVGFSAIFISLCSLGLAIHHGHTMERLVQANSRPFLQFESSNGQVRPSGEIVPELSATLSNPGLGAARIERFTIEIDHHPANDWPDAIHRLKEEAAQKGIAPSGDVPTKLSYATVAPGFLKGGGEQTILRWPRGEASAALWDYVDSARQSGRISFQACYCSMFEECWIVRSDAFRPNPVAACAA